MTPKEKVNARRRARNAELKRLDPEAHKAKGRALYEKIADCKRAANSRWYRANKESVKKRDKLKHLKRYNLSVEDYQRMLDDQNNRCKICESPPGAKALAVDHCHATGVVRGLLCSFCNTRLAVLESPEWVTKAYVYLQAKKRGS